MNSAGRKRLDQHLVDRGHYASRSRAADAIRRGCVKVGGQTATRAAAPVSPGDRIEIEDLAGGYVSRAALKLKAGLEATGYSPGGRTALDIGASTGGFTQVLLEVGAERVIAIDVGHGQLAPEIANDARVTRLEGVNARDLTPAMLGDAPIGFVVADVSFISLKLALPPALALAETGAFGIFLVKPQFEVGREHVGKGGIVRDAKLGEEVARDVAGWIGAQPGWRLTRFLPSPVTGGDGNREYIAAAIKDEAACARP
ncbi:MAG: TlyA family RNA methyltransferase [Pseudomonadota bacterium]|nr:TlyA family RNA methyltransferase [Pseudomonadota bacterium]